MSIKNASAHDLGNGVYNIDFILTHAVSAPVIERVDRIRVVWGGESHVAAFNCRSDPWTLRSDQSGIISTSLNVLTTPPDLYAPCGPTSERLTLSRSTFGSLPKAGDTIQLGFDGIFEDATPFTLDADVK